MHKIISNLVWHLPHFLISAMLSYRSPSGYALPASVTVNVGGTVLAASNYTYNSSTGVLSIPAAKITADTTVSAYAPLNISDSYNRVTLEKTEYTYTGNDITPAVYVNGIKALENNYTAEYSNNTNVGTATVTVTGKNSYAGTKTLTFEILPADISGATVTLGDSLTYNGATQTQTVKSVTVNGITLTEGVDYTVSGNTGMNAGTYTLKITGKDNTIGEITKEREIARKSVTASATVQDKIYDGTTDVDASAIEITFDGLVDGDDFEVSKCTGIFLSSNAGNNQTIYVAYDVSGEDVDNYEIYEDYITAPEDEYYYIKTKANILPKDISDAEITLGDALTYNGEEQAQTVTSVTVDGLDVTYDISGNTATNVGVYELTITGNGNFTGTKTALYEIAVDVSGLDYSEIDGYYWSDVKSTDKDRLEYVYNQLVNAETELASDEKKAEWFALLNNCNEMLLTIKSVTSHLESFKNEVAGYDIETVTSDDYDYLEELYESEAQWLDDFYENYTDEEIKEFSDTLDIVSKLKTRITETKTEYDRVIAAADGYDEATVTSADKAALVKLNEDIYALALTDNVTAEEKSNLQSAHDEVLGLIDKLTAISNEIKRIIEAVDKYVFESVKSSDKADIQQLIVDIKALLDTQNITADERTLLEGADETCDKLIAKIDETVAEINRINDATNAYDEATATSADKADIEKLLADIKALTDGDNITDTEREQLNGNKETLEALLERINAVADEIARIDEAVNAYDEEKVKSTDKADLEKLVEDIKALTDATNITEDERTKLGELDATVDSLIKKIDDTAAEIARIDKAVNAYDEETVKSSDKADLEKLIEDIKALTDGENLTEDEKAALEADDEAVDALIERLAEVAEEIKRVDEAVKSYDENTVKSTDKEDLAQLKEDVQALIDSDNTTENEKTALGEMIADIEALEDKIEETENQLEEIGNIENSYDPETVTSDDKAAIEAAIAEIEAVNPDNLTDGQKAEYAEIKADLENLLDEIEAAENAVAEIGVELEMFDENRVTIFWEDDIEALKAKIDELLADENMGEAEIAKLNEYKAQCDNLIEIIHDPCKYFSCRFFYFIWDCLTWKYNGILYIFSNLFGC